MRTKKEIMPLARVPRPVQVVQPNKTCKCGACEPPKPKLPEGTRRLKVYSKWKSNGTGHTPVILLQGKWLHGAGFEYGDEILVTVAKRKLTVNFERK